MPPTTNTLEAAEEALDALLAGTLPSASRTKRRKSRSAAAKPVVDEAARIRALQAASKIRQKELEIRDRILSMREEKARGSKKRRKRKAVEVLDEDGESE